MTLSDPSTETPAQLAADLQDERLIRSEGIRGMLQSMRLRVRGGDLGSWPVVIGLVVIWAIFEILNPIFLSADNLINLSKQCAAVGTISIGVVLVLLLGEIDLSVGSVSGVASAILGIGMINLHWPIIVAILAALAAGVLIGLLYGVLLTRFGVPSFVSTLAGLLGFLGLQLWILGPLGSVNIPFTSWIVQFANGWFLPPWAAYVISVLAGVGILISDLRRSGRRARAGLSTGSRTLTVVKAVVLAAVLVAIAVYFATDRGTSVMFVFFILLVVVMNFFLTRTRWGRAVFAVGGNEEAARRAGIKVNRIYISVFILCSVFAIVGGILLTATLSSASSQSGTGDVNLNAIAAAVIGGTSLFGGRGSAWSALLGIVVIQSISSGLTLLSLDASVRFMITGAVLLLAVVIDSLSRRSRASHGQA
ncbi:MAG: sugar ABC transporter permease [Microbacteriaceae bacterium]|nr:MAG: sugar ABC transporter permease [Microbacteriaceae bacterium]